jgi:hypothetical protein
LKKLFLACSFERSTIIIGVNAQQIISVRQICD